MLIHREDLKSLCCSLHAVTTQHCTKVCISPTLHIILPSAAALWPVHVLHVCTYSFVFNLICFFRHSFWNHTMQTNRFKVGISPTLQSFIPLTPPFRSPLILFFGSFIHHVIFLTRLFGFNVHYNEQSCGESELSIANVRTISMVIIALKIESGSFFCTVKSYLYVCLQLSGLQLESFYHHDSTSYYKAEWASSRSTSPCFPSWSSFFSFYSMWQCPAADILWNPLHTTSKHVVYLACKITDVTIRNMLTDKRILY